MAAIVIMNGFPFIPCAVGVRQKERRDNLHGDIPQEGGKPCHIEMRMLDMLSVRVPDKLHKQMGPESSHFRCRAS